MVGRSPRRSLPYTLVEESRDHLEALGNRLMLHVLYFATESKAIPGASSLLARSGDLWR